MDKVTRAVSGAGTAAVASCKQLPVRIVRRTVTCVALCRQLAAQGGSHVSTPRPNSRSPAASQPPANIYRPYRAGTDRKASLYTHSCTQLTQLYGAALWTCDAELMRGSGDQSGSRSGSCVQATQACGDAVWECANWRPAHGCTSWFCEHGNVTRTRAWLAWLAQGSHLSALLFKAA